MALKESRMLEKYESTLKLLDLAEKFEALARCEPDFLKAQFFRSLARDIKQNLYESSKQNGD